MIYSFHLYAVNTFAFNALAFLDIDSNHAVQSFMDLHAILEENKYGMFCFSRYWSQNIPLTNKYPLKTVLKQACKVALCWQCNLFHNINNTSPGGSMYTVTIITPIIIGFSLI